MSAKYTAEEVAKHNEAENLWIVLHGKVYDVTKFLTEHPGGEEVLLALAGQNATKCFDDIGHSQEAIQLKDTLEIGVLDGSLLPAEPPAVKGKNASDANEKQPTVDDDDWTYEETKQESSPHVPIFVALGALVYAVLFYYVFY